VPLPPSRRTGRLRLLVVGLGVALVTGCTSTATVARAALRVRPHSAYADIPTMLNRQARALEQGDEAGWLAPVDRAQTAVVQRYRDLFRAMRAVGVVTLVPIISLEDVDHVKPGTRLVVSVVYAFCIQVPDCPTTGLGGAAQPTETMFTQMTFVEQGEGVLISGFDLMPIPIGGLGRAPWVDNDLEYLSGKRVTVIASRDMKSRMPAALAAADAAATVADRYAQWVWPVRYLVYLANPSQWRAWIAGYPGSDGVVAYAAAPSTSSEVVVVNVAVQDTNADPLVSVLRHEFGHVVTLLGVHRNDVTSPRLFLEGIADYIAEDGRPLNAYLPLGFVRQFVHSGHWTGDLDQAEPLFLSSSLRDVETAYGLGMLTIRCIADRYGKPKMLDFAERVLRKRADTDVAATAALGEPWSAVKTACASYVRAI
jgi:hypothetical protein